MPDEDFLWGVAISSHQNEGGAPASDWTHAERIGRFPHSSGLGSDFRKHWREDLDRVKHELGGNAIRLSIEWARVEPTPGKVDAEEMKWLTQLFEGARDRGLSVIATLHHFTSPQWIYDAPGPNGWESAATVGHFDRYVRTIAKEFAPAVRYWITFNEPSNVIGGGYLTGKIPPFRFGPLAFWRAANHVNAAHERAYDSIHELDPDAMVSISEFSGIIAVGPGIDYVPSRILDPLRTRVPDADGFIKPKHMDYIGLHYYGDIPPKEMAGWPLRFDRFGVRPERFGRIIRDTWKRYKLPILIGENGLATYNHEARADGWDAARYLDAHVQVVREAIAEGVPIHGYCWWTLTDNYEWGSFDARFGLYRVECVDGDYERQATPAVAAFRRAVEAGVGR